VIQIFMIKIPYAVLKSRKFTARNILNGRVLERVANKVCQALIAPSGEPAVVDKIKDSIVVVSIVMLPVINILL